MPIYTPPSKNSRFNPPLTLEKEISARPDVSARRRTKIPPSAARPVHSRAATWQVAATTARGPAGPRSALSSRDRAPPLPPSCAPRAAVVPMPGRRRPDPPPLPRNLAVIPTPGRRRPDPPPPPRILAAPRPRGRIRSPGSSIASSTPSLATSGHLRRTPAPAILGKRAPVNSASGRISDLKNPSGLLFPLSS